MIELLVIAIIGILAATLLPALAKAEYAARCTACAAGKLAINYLKWVRKF